MSITAVQPEKQERELVKAGTHAGYLYRVIYLGTQKRIFEGKEIQSQKIWVDFELPKEVVEYEDKETKEKKSFVRTIGAEYTLSLADKGKLLPMIQGWLGRSLTGDELAGFDICSLLGKPAFITIAHTVAKNGSTYANIASISPVMNGYVMPEAVNKVIEISKESWGGADFDELPDFLKKKIEESNEWKVIGQANTTLNDPTIPVIDPVKDATMHQGDNMGDSNGSHKEVRIEEVPF